MLLLYVELPEMMVGMFVYKLSELFRGHLPKEPMGKIIAGQIGISLDTPYPVLLFGFDIAAGFGDDQQGRRVGVPGKERFICQDLFQNGLTDQPAQKMPRHLYFAEVELFTEDTML